MALTWLQLARAGAPPASERTIEMVNENKRKIFAKPPTVGADGELEVEPAVFKPRPRNKPTAAAPANPPARTAAAHKPAPVAARPTSTPARPAPALTRPVVQAVPQPAPARTSSPFTFPGAVSVLHNAQRSTHNGSDDGDDDDETAAGVATYYELLDELTTRHNCDAARRMIQRFLSRKTMTQAAFLRAINVNHGSFVKFMSYTGREKGRNNKTYHAALLYLHEHQHDHADDEAVAPAAAPANRTSDQPGKVSRKEQARMADAYFSRIKNIVLPEPVCVFDDCDEVRQKLNELLEGRIVSHAMLTKHLGVAANSLRRFQSLQGTREGCSIRVYRLAYIMFEKLRIAQGQPKSAKRLQMERENPEGYSLRRDPAHDSAVESESMSWEETEP